MNPIEFDEMNGIAAEDQPEYLNLPMYRDHEQVISCWKMTWRERVQVLFTGKVWLRLLHSEQSKITPSALDVSSPWSDG